MTDSGEDDEKIRKYFVCKKSRIYLALFLFNK